MGNNLELKLEVIVKYIKLMVYSENLLNDLDWKILSTVRNYEFEKKLVSAVSQNNKTIELFSRISTSEKYKYNII